MEVIDQDDCWKVIDSYFKQNGLVAQQIFSFERFLQYSVQEIIKEFRETDIKRTLQYYGPNDEEATYKIIFGSATVNQYPRQHESDNRYHAIFPHEARIRGLTYQTEIFCAVTVRKIKYGEKNYETGITPVISDEVLFSDDKVQIGKIPVMVRSKFCHLSSLSKDEIVNNARECRYD
jgi:DNA-directed RNA polymerase II subunit RPB2